MMALSGWSLFHFISFSLLFLTLLSHQSGSSVRHRTLSQQLIRPTTEANARSWSICRRIRFAGTNNRHWTHLIRNHCFSISWSFNSHLFLTWLRCFTISLRRGENPSRWVGGWSRQLFNFLLKLKTRLIKSNWNGFCNVFYEPRKCSARLTSTGSEREIIFHHWVLVAFIERHQPKIKAQNTGNRHQKKNKKPRESRALPNGLLLCIIQLANFLLAAVISHFRLPQLDKEMPDALLRNN